MLFCVLHFVHREARRNRAQVKVISLTDKNNCIGHVKGNSFEAVTNRGRDAAAVTVRLLRERRVSEFAAVAMHETLARLSDETSPYLMGRRLLI